MKKDIKNVTLVSVLLLSLLFIAPVIAGNKNQNAETPLKGTNKASSQLPEQSNVPWPAGIVEYVFGTIGTPHVVEGCRAGGPDILVSVPGFPGPVPGGSCCKGPEISDELYAPNQCCNPPDIIYPPEEYTPGNHCLCFAMRIDF